MKRFALSVGLLLCLGAAQAQQPEGMDDLRMAPRANVVTYDDENAIEHLRYDDSPYYLSLMEDWEVNNSTGVSEYTQTYEFPKEWRDYRVYFRFKAYPGYGLYVDDKFVGCSHDAGTVTEFDITDLVRFGKSHLLTLRYSEGDEGSLLEAVNNVLTGDCAILLKPRLNVLDYTLLTDYDAASSTGSYALDATLYNQRRKGKGYLELELWDPRGKQVEKLGKWCYFDNRTESTNTISSSLADVLPWTAETPRRYTAVIRLYNEKMELEDIVGTRFGFRKVAYDKNNLTLNGRAITLRGINIGNYGALDPDEVKALRAEMVQMKCNNINAIHTTGLTPEDHKFYELCDELGFYVVVSANIFPRNDNGHLIATDNEYTDLFASRVRNLYGEYKNHPSIIAWSLGESRDNGVCMSAAYKALRQADPSRPVLYAGAEYADNTDLIAPNQANVDLLRQYLAKPQSRPLVMLSFGDMEGNTFGGTAPLWQMVRDHASIQGGFYNCMVWQPFTRKPYLAELKQLYRPFDVQMTSVSADAAEFDITNLCDFRSLSDYRLDYVICSNLKPNVIAGDVTLSLKPGETKDIKLKIPKLTLYAGEELCIQFTLRQRNNTTSVPKNTVLYTAQFPLPSDNISSQPLPLAGLQPLNVDRDSLHHLIIYNDNFSLQFDDSLGTITSLVYRGQPTVSGPVRLDFMRSPSPNDILDPNGLRQWQRVGLDHLKAEVLATNVRKIDNQSVGIDVLMRYGSDKDENLFDVRQTYLILTSGDVLLSNDITVSEQVKNTARIGLLVPYDSRLDTAEWFGRNIESYIDRCAAGRIAQQSLPVAEMTYPYAGDHWAPHTYGNHTEVRWLALRNGATGLYADIIDTLCQFSIQHDTLHIDYRHTGIGGASAGMNLDETMLVKDHHYRFTLHLRPFDCMENNAQDFRRIIYPKVQSAIIEMPVITKNRDRFDGPIQVSIKCPTPKVEIRYTLDGTAPTEKSALYTKPFTLQSSTIVRARAFKKGEPPSFVATQQFTFDYVVGCTFAHKPNTPYNKNAARALIDGQKGDVNDLSHGWLGFSGHDLQADFELGKAVTVGSVVLRFAHVPEAWVFAPAGVLVSVSADGKQFSEPVPATITYNPSDQSMNTSQLQVVTVPVNTPNVRFVRIVARPLARIPEWHRAKGLHPWLMMDEIEIQETIEK